MVAYSFRPRFIEPIRMRTKQQTIRAPRSGRSQHAKPGDELQLYSGMRTRYCVLIGHYRCLAVSPITLTFNADPLRDRVVEIGAPALPLDVFARCDGFSGWADLRSFWEDEHPGVDYFEGVIIRWGPV